MWARKGSLCLILKQPLAQPASKNKREVKTGSFSPPGVGGVLHDKSRRLSRPALPGRSAASLADCILQFVRRLTTKELVFLRFVAPRNAPVNGKKRRDRREKHNPSPLRAGSQTTALFVQCRFERLVQLARSLPFFVATSCPISAEISPLHPFIFSRPYGPSYLMQTLRQRLGSGFARRVESALMPVAEVLGAARIRRQAAQEKRC